MACEDPPFISYLGIMATGALLDGKGYASAEGAMIANYSSAGNGIFTKATDCVQRAKTLQTLGMPSSETEKIATVGNRDFLGSGAFNNAIPDDLSSRIPSATTSTAIQGIKAHVDLMFGTRPLDMVQTVQIAGDLPSQSLQLAPSLDAANKGINFGRQSGVESLVYPADGVFPTFLGSAYRNYKDVVTNGLSSLFVDASDANFALLADDLDTLGSAFSLDVAQQFGNPGQVVGALAAVDGLDATGLDVVLANLRIDPSTIFNLGDATYNRVMQAVLDAVTTPELIANAQELLGSSIENMTSLGDYTDFDKVFAQSKAVLDFDSYASFATKLAAIELGSIEASTQLAALLRSTKAGDLPSIGNSTQFLQGEYLVQLINNFLGGTGTRNAITITDMVGLLGGQGVGTAPTDLGAALDALHTAGRLTKLNGLYQDLLDTLNGLHVVNPSDGALPAGVTAEKIVDDSIHGPVTILETDVNPSFSGGSAPYYTGLIPLYLSSKLALIEAELRVIRDSANVDENIDKAITAHRTIMAKLDKEKDFQSRIDMNYTYRNGYPDIALSWTTNLPTLLEEEGYKDLILAMVEQAQATGDSGADFVFAYLRETENKEASDIYDVTWRSEFCET